jgi:autoinducer 2-degrading protein
MIIRIVKLSFDPEKVDTFLSIFNKYEEKISGFEGCVQLELLNDINTPNIYFTYSYWQEEAFLGAYRDSDLFKDVWAQTKVLFNDKPQAWSVKRV